MSIFLLLSLFFATHARLIAPDPTLLLRDRHGAFLAEVGSAQAGELGYWPLGELPERVVAATLTSEDRRFWQHAGVDPLAVGRALWLNARSGRRVSGASTIAMQVARMQGGGQRTYWRKTLESLTACALTLRYGRAAVLAHYLRLVPYGHRIHGIAYAARRYFDKPVDDLSWAETALLAAIPQAPARMDLYTERGRLRAIQRARRILDALHEAGTLPPEEHALAASQLASIHIPPLAARPRNAIHAILHLQRLLGDPVLCAREPVSPFTRMDQPLAPPHGRTGSRADGLTGTRAHRHTGLVNSTLDLDIQNVAATAVADTVSALAPRGAGNAAAIVLDRETNAVRAWVGSTDYFDAPHRGAYDYTQVRRSPGSALKPFIFALALERGVITPATMLDDLQRPAGDIVNADETFLGPLLPRVALANSRNVPAATLLAATGLDTGYAFLRSLGLHDDRRAPRELGLGMAFGTLPVTLERLVHAYSALARDGRLADLVWYDGQSLGPARAVLSEDSAREITLFLADPMARLPSFPRMGPTEYPFPVAIKTGTSSRFRDALAVAYSPRYVVGAWLGHPDQRPMSRLTAAGSAAGIARAILTRLHGQETDGLSDLPFPPPRDFRALRVCALTGKRAGTTCDQVFLEWFRPGEEPLDDCDAHVQLAIDVRDGLRASSSTPHQFIAVRRFTQLPTRYAAWAAAGGLSHPPLVPSANAALRFAGSPTAAGAHPARQDLHRAPTISVVTPQAGTRLLRDPESPPQQATLALRATVDPPAQQVVWYVDGAPYQVADYPYSARWPLQPGEHTFQARLPFTTHGSAPVRITVQ